MSKVVPEVGPGKEIVARIFVCPTEDADRARFVGRIGIAAYLNVAVYAAFHEWLGRGPLLEEMWTAWRSGDRKAALAAIPDEVVDALVVHGSPDECRAHVQRYVDNGVTVPVLAVLPGGDDLGQGDREPRPRPVLTADRDALGRVGRPMASYAAADGHVGQGAASMSVVVEGEAGGGQLGRQDPLARRAPSRREIGPERDAQGEAGDGEHRRAVQGPAEGAGERRGWSPAPVRWR